MLEIFPSISFILICRPEIGKTHDVGVHHDKLRQFFENDRKVLRFYCSWDDRASLYGELRFFVRKCLKLDAKLFPSG